MKVEVLFYPNSNKCLFRITTKETILILEEAETKKLWRELSKAFRAKEPRPTQHPVKSRAGRVNR